MKELTRNERALRHEILARSVAKTWSEARLEWGLTHVEFASRDHPATCLCTHHPIIELCYLTNRVNKQEALVGNVCVTKFFMLGSEQVFNGLRRVLIDPRKPPNAAVIEFAWTHYWITNWEAQFLQDTMRKRVLSDKQRQMRIQLVKKIVTRVQRGPRQGDSAPRVVTPEMRESTPTTRSFRMESR